jgi:hypothetical protein
LNDRRLERNGDRVVIGVQQGLGYEVVIDSSIVSLFAITTGRSNSMTRATSCARNETPSPPLRLASALPMSTTCFAFFMRSRRLRLIVSGRLVSRETYRSCASKKLKSMFSLNGCRSTTYAVRASMTDVRDRRKARASVASWTTVPSDRCW